MNIHLDKIAKSIENRECVLFIGAGISQTCGLPSGSQLAQLMADELKLEGEYTLPEISEYYEVTFGRQELINFLKSTIREKENGKEKLQGYKIINELPLNIIITTNYDNILQSLSQNYNVINKNSDIWKIKEGVKNIIKIHGDFDSPIRDIIITESDFYTYQEKYPNLIPFLEYTFSSKTVIFLGFGLKDINTTNILFWANKTLAERRAFYAVLKTSNDYHKKVLEKRDIIVINEDLISFLNDLASVLNIEINGESNRLEFNAFYGKSIIKVDELTNINFELINNTADPIETLTYRFEGFKNGELVASYAKHVFEHAIKPGKTYKSNFQEVDPFKRYFSGTSGTGIYESKIYIEYIQGKKSKTESMEEQPEINTVIDSAQLTVKSN